MTFIRGLGCTSTLAIGIAFSSQVAAQAAPASDRQPVQAAAALPDGLADIIVTAQRRSESLQKTALTIQVFQAEVLAQSGVTNAFQLTNIAPSLQVSSAGAASSVYLRGVGAYTTTAAQSPAIPYYTDGVYVARPQSLGSEFFDVERLEVLKGPQGTLYGRNASGGAINIISRRPKLGVVEGRAELEIGNYGNQTGEAAINVPIGSTVAIRASAQIVDKGGYTSAGLSDDVHQSGRVKLLWEPSSEVSLLLNGSYGHVGGKGQGWVVLNKDIPGWYPWLDVSGPQGQAYVLSHGLPIPGAVRPSRSEQATQDLDFYNISAEFNMKLGSDVTLTVIPAYRYSKMRYTALFSATYINGYGYADVPARPETSKATSVEARLGGESDRLKWVAGVYYYNEDQRQSFEFDVGNASHGGSEAKFGTRSYAAFGQATFSLADKVRLIGGLRYTSDRRSLTDGEISLISPVLFFFPPSSPALVPCAFPATVPAKCIADEFEGKATYKNVSWKGGVEADVLEDGLLYATVSRGFKAGGFNTLSVLGSPGTALPFKPEKLTSYEVGFKNRFLNNRLQVNISGFYWDYKDHQEPYLAFTNAGTLGLIYFNAGATKIYGGTLDVIAQPWSGGTFTASVEYAHARYDDYKFNVPTFTVAPGSTGCPTGPGAFPGFTTIDCSGFQTVRTPAWTGGARYSHEFNLGDGKLRPMASMTFASSRWLNNEFTPIERAKGYAMFDAAITYEAPNDRFAVTGFVRNIDNARSYSTAYPNPLSATVSANIAAPRTYGVRFAVNY